MQRWIRAAGLTLAGWGLTVALAQQPENQGRTDTGREANRMQRDVPGSHTPQQVADAMRDMSTSLADSIRAAESATGGKAFSAECRFQGQGNAHTCIVLVTAPGNKLIEVTVDTQSSKVTNQREISSWQGRSFAGAYTTGGTERGGKEHGFRRYSAIPRRWQKGTDVIGKAVKNPENESLGKIEDLAVDANSGRILYAVLSFGGVLGIGDKYFAVPWSSFELPGEANHFVLGIDKTQLKNAEGFDKNHWPNMADQQWATRTNAYYGQPPYWAEGQGYEHTGDMQHERPSGEVSHRRTNEEPSDGRQPGENNRTGMQNEARDRMYQPALAWQKASDLIGKDVKNRQNEDIGDLKNVVIDPDNGRIIYGMVKFDGKYAAVPWCAMALSNDSSHFVLDIAKDRMKDLASINGDQWPDLVDRSFMDRSYNDFNQRPYWSEGGNQ